MPGITASEILFVADNLFQEQGYKLHHAMAHGSGVTAQPTQTTVVVLTRHIDTNT